MLADIGDDRLQVLPPQLHLEGKLPAQVVGALAAQKQVGLIIPRNRPSVKALRLLRRQVVLAGHPLDLPFQILLGVHMVGAAHKGMQRSSALRAGEGTFFL